VAYVGQLRLARASGRGFHSALDEKLILTCQPSEDAAGLLRPPVAALLVPTMIRAVRVNRSGRRHCDGQLPA
jgi:hypothetical protein